MASRCTAQALADGGASGVATVAATPKSAVTPLAGLASTGSAPTPSAPPPSLPHRWRHRHPHGLRKCLLVWPTPRQSRRSPLWPVLPAVVQHRLPQPWLTGGQPPARCLGLPTHAPISLVAVCQPQPLSNRQPPFPGARPWLSEYAAATIPVAPA